MEAVKPLLKTHNATLTLSDEIVNIGERYYIKATAKLCIGADCIEVYGYAREGDNQKGFDCMQLTGATSSYARKYALNGLFCIDDAKDSDYTNTGEAPKAAPQKEYKNKVDVWLSEEKFKAALKMTDIVELKAFIQEWCKAPKGMKEDYRTQLIELGISLNLLNIRPEKKLSN